MQILFINRYCDDDDDDDHDEEEDDDDAILLEKNEIKRY